jgi:valyl-tRNA synthetase
VHLQAWPTTSELGDAASADPVGLEAVAAVLAGVRGAKSTAKVGMRTPVEHATITGPEGALRAIREAERDLRAVGSITGDLDLVTSEEGTVSVDAVLGEPPPKR